MHIRKFSVGEVNGYMNGTKSTKSSLRCNRLQKSQRKSRLEQHYLSDAAFFANLLSQFLDRYGPQSPLTQLMTSVMKSKTDSLPVPFSQLLDPESPYMMCLALDPRYSHMAASETWSSVQDYVNTHSLTQPPLLRLPVEPKGYIDLVYQQLTCPQTAFLTQESEIDRFRRLEPLPRTTDLANRAR